MPSSKGEPDNPKLREKVKEEVKAMSKGGGPGSWSAWKAGELARRYEEQGGGYVDKGDHKNKSQKGPPEKKGEGEKKEEKKADEKKEDKKDEKKEEKKDDESEKKDEKQEEKKEEGKSGAAKGGKAKGGKKK